MKISCVLLVLSNCPEFEVETATTSVDETVVRSREGEERRGRKERKKGEEEKRGRRKEREKGEGEERRGRRKERKKKGEEEEGEEEEGEKKGEEEERRERSVSTVDRLHTYNDGATFQVLLISQSSCMLV